MNKHLTSQVQALYNRALALKNQGQAQASLSECDKILTIAPKQFDALILKGIILSEHGKHIDALLLFDEALKIKKDPAILNNRANIYQQMKQFDLAMDDYDAAIKLNLRFLEGHYNKANCFKETNQYHEAIVWYKKTLKINPKYFHAWNNMGLCCQSIQDFEGALAACQEAVKIEPNNYVIYNNMGFTLHVLMRLDEAIAAFNKSIELNPDQTDSKFNIGFVYLLKGDLEKGWAGHEERWKNKYRPAGLPKLWTGEDVAGKTIYIVHEQGLGDTIQFIRYAKQLKAAGAAKIIAGVKPEIAVLVSSMPEIDEINTSSQFIPDYDYQCPMMSLPYVFKTRVHNIPYEPYFKADPVNVSRFAEMMGPKTKLRVGIVWSGGFRADQPEIWAVNERRNIKPEKLAEIYNPNVEFFNLQFGAKELPFPMVDLMGEVKDFSDTAAIIENLDLVISVDTSTAHVAGAMGKEVWMLNRFDTCWRWLEDRKDSPWYPSFTIYRQEKFNNWDNVVADIKRDLDARAK